MIKLGPKGHFGSIPYQRIRIRHCFISSPKKAFSDLFLPLDYPDSVGKEYMSYQLCDSIQGLCSYLRGVVSTSAVLTAAGVGQEDANAMSAAMTWALRDGLGMVGGLLFSYAASSLFDGYIKEWKLFADIINDVGLTLDMLAPYFSSHVLYVTSLATVCKVMCGISAGATKGSITQHFCKKGNMADLNAKESTQETLVSLIGMILGVSLANYLQKLEDKKTICSMSASSISWTIFNILTIFHVCINYIGVRLLHLKTLNTQRTSEAIAPMVAMAASAFNKKNDWVIGALSAIPPPNGISESLLGSVSFMLFPRQSRGLLLGARLSDVINLMTVEDVQEQLRSNHNYIICIDGKKCIYVALLVGTNEQDQLDAYIHAEIVKEILKTQQIDKKTALTIARVQMSILKSQGLSLSVFEEKGWNVKDRLYLGFARWRIEVAKPKDQ